MNKRNKNICLEKRDAKDGEMEIASLCDEGQRTLWFIASEVAGLPQMPTSARRARDELERLLKNRDHLKRRRVGTKGYEYHISILPLETQQSLGSEFPEAIQEPEQSKSNSLPIDRELLQTSIEVIELLCEKKRLRMSAEKKAKVIALIYTISLDEKKPDESVVYQILELAS